MRIPMGLQEDIQYRAGFIDGPPQPLFPASDLDADLIQKPPGASAGLPVPEFFGKKRREFDVPLAEGFMADGNAALVQQFLDVTLAQGKTVVKPDGVLDNAQRKTVSVRLAVSHG